MKKVLIPLAQGFEELEFISIADVLTRASKLDTSLEIFIASLTENLSVKGANEIVINAKYKLEDIKDNDFEAICLAGGYEGMLNLKASDLIIKIIQDLNSKNKTIGAICAAPIVLDSAGVLKGEFSCYPECDKFLNAQRVNKAVCVNENIITSAGPATGVLFALELVKALSTDEVKKALSEALLVDLK